MAEPQYPRVAQALKLAKNVVNGKAPACRYVVLACQRHLHDLAASKSASTPTDSKLHRRKRSSRSSN
jgi:hypothetical protein